VLPRILGNYLRYLKITSSIEGWVRRSQNYFQSLQRENYCEKDKKKKKKKKARALRFEN